MANRVIIDQTINTVTTDQCPDIHNSVVVNNDTPSTIGVTENVTNIVTVAVPGPQGPVGPQGPIGLGGDITGSQYYAAIYKSATGLFTGSIYDSGSFTGVGAIASIHAGAPERLFVDAGDTNSYNLISGHGTINNYLQLNIKNFSSGNTGSSDVVATADNGDEFSQFIDMGINSSGYNVEGGIGGSNDAYLYSTGQDLLIGNASSGKRVIIFNGSGPALDNARIYITDQGTVGINSSDASLSNPEALLVEQLVSGTYSPTEFNNLIIGRGTVNENYMQLNMINKGSGSAASTDIVATNDIGNETSYYIDMGINSSGFNTPNAVGIANDAYLYSTGRHLHIGNVSNYPIQFFVGGLDTDANRKMQLNPDGFHQLTGSLNATQGFTGSLYGTASWTQNSISSSYISGSAAIITNLTSSNDARINGVNIGLGRGNVDRNISIGSSALSSNISGFNNIAIGATALSSSTTGVNNVAIGGNALSINTTGGNVVAIGTSALGSNSIGQSNVAVGTSALRSNDSGSLNIAIGPTSLFSNTTGSRNTAIGVNAGYGTGANANTIGSNNIFIGYQSVGVSATESDRTWIGNSSTTSTWLAGNTILGITSNNGYRLQVNQASSGSLWVSGSSVMSGSLSVTEGITGSLFGTASWALNAVTASYLSGYVSPFPYTGSAIITGSLTVTGSIYVGNTIISSSSDIIIGQYNSIRGSFLPSSNYISFNGNVLTLQSSTTAKLTNGPGEFVIDGNMGFSRLGLPSNWNVVIGLLGDTVVPSAKVTINSTDKGFLPTRTDLTSNISSPAQGLITYLTGSSNEGLWYYDSGSIKNWTRLLNDTGSQSISGSLNVTQAVTASNLLVTNTITAQTLVVQTITSSTDFVTGSTRFGSLLTNTHQFTGSVTVTGSLVVNGSPVILTNQTASMSVASASFATTASYALTASYVSGSSSTSVTASYAFTSSYATSFNVSGTLNVGKTNIEFQENTNVTSGSWRVVSSEPTASYKAAFFDYVMFSGSIARAGTVYSVWSASYAEYYENYTGDVGGSTSGVTLQAAISGSNIQLQATASNSTWTIRSLVRML